jgi:hypothetical protein
LAIKLFTEYILKKNQISYVNVSKPLVHFTALVQMMIVKVQVSNF